MRKSSRVMSSVMVLIILLTSLIGCGKSTDVSDNNVTKAGTVEKTTTVEAPKEPLNIKMVLNLSADFALENNPLMDEVQKRANVKLELTVPPSKSYNEKLSIIMASGNIPDVTYFTLPTDPLFVSLAKDGAFAALDEYIKSSPNILKYNYPQGWDTVKPKEDGKIYGITSSTWIRGDIFYIRKDWLDKLKLDIPKTIEDYYNVMKAFTEQDPDGNNKKDTYGMTGFDAEGFITYSALPFINAFGGGLGWIERDGQLVNTDASPEYKQGLEFIAKCLKDEVIDPALLTNKPWSDGEAFTSGKVGLYRSWAGAYIYFSDKVKAVNPNAEIIGIAAPVSKITGKVEVTPSSYTGVYGVYAVNAKAKDVAGIVKFFDWAASDEAWDLFMNGPVGLYYTEENGKRVFKDDDATKKFLAYRKDFALQRHAETPEFIIPPSATVEQTEVIKQLMKISLDYVNSPVGAFIPPSLSSVKPEVTKHKWEVIGKIMYGQLPVDEYDNWYKEYLDNGGEQVNMEIMGYYEKKKASN